MVVNSFNDPLQKDYTNNNHRKYYIENDHAVFMLPNDNKEVKDTRLNYYDIKDIDVSYCTFEEFAKVLTFAEECYTGFEFDKDLLLSLKPSEAEKDIRINYAELAEEKKFDFAKQGDMVLYNDMQKIVAASYWSLYVKNPCNYNTTLSKDGFFIDNVFLDADYINAGAYDSFNLGRTALKVKNKYCSMVAEFHCSSTFENPVILVSANIENADDNSVRNDYYIVDLSNIDKNNASFIELFAYYSYLDSKKEPDWYTYEGFYRTNDSFNHLKDCNLFSFDNLDDIIIHKYDINKINEDALIYINEQLNRNSLYENGNDMDIDEYMLLIEKNNILNKYKGIFQEYMDLILEM